MDDDRAELDYDPDKQNNRIVTIGIDIPVMIVKHLDLRLFRHDLEIHFPAHIFPKTQELTVPLILAYQNNR